jgi:hypothetical protein
LKTSLACVLLSTDILLINVILSTEINLPICDEGEVTNKLQLLLHSINCVQKPSSQTWNATLPASINTALYRLEDIIKTHRPIGIQFLQVVFIRRI